MDFFGPNVSSDPPPFVIGHFEVKARSLGIILFVSSLQKNNYVRFHLNHFKLKFDRKRIDYLEDDHTQLIEDDVNIYIGFEEEFEEEYAVKSAKRKNKIEHGLYVVPIQYTDPNSRGNDAGSSKDLIAVPLCHIHYNAKTNIDDFSVTDLFEAKWGDQTFILPLDLRPFDNIGKTMKKYHRDFNEAKRHRNPGKEVKERDKEIEDESLKPINEKEELSHQQSHTSSVSLSSHASNTSLAHMPKHSHVKSGMEAAAHDHKRTFTHDAYQFDPPFPSVKYIVSTETILEKLGIETPQNSIPEAFYSSIVEPIGNSLRMIRGLSHRLDSKISALSDDQQ